jgi:hypothetical protein
MKRASAIVLIPILVCIAWAAAQGPPPMPTPGPELKKLDYLVGTWKSESEMKPLGGESPGIKMSGVDHVEWMPGHFFLVVHSTESSQMFHVVATGYMGYSNEDKVYTIDIFNSLGDAEHSRGTIEAGTWTFTSTRKMGDQIMKDRYTITVTSPTSYSYKLEIAPAEGGAYSTIAEGKKTRVSAPKAAKGSGRADPRK